jgi:hypothetical protein
MSDQDDLSPVNFELLLDEDAEASLGDLRAAAQDGEESGEAEEFDVESFLAEDEAEASVEAPGAAVELGLTEETNPLPPAPLKASKAVAPKKGAMSKDDALLDMEPTERKYELAKKSMDKSCRPYFGHGWRA